MLTGPLITPTYALASLPPGTLNVPNSFPLALSTYRPKVLAVFSHIMVLQLPVSMTPNVKWSLIITSETYYSLSQCSTSRESFAPLAQLGACPKPVIAEFILSLFLSSCYTPCYMASVSPEAALITFAHRSYIMGIND